MEDRIVREHERRKITGVARSTWHRYEANGSAPKRRQLGGRMTGWLLSEIKDWMESRPTPHSSAPKQEAA